MSVPAQPQPEPVEQGPVGPEPAEQGPVEMELVESDSVDSGPAASKSAAAGSPAPDHRLRAADADRELVHQILSAAMSSGALTPSEYEERALKASTAKTFGDLDALTDDLPVAQLGVPLPQPGDPYPTGVTRPGTGSGRTQVRHRLAIMSGSEL